MIIIDVTRTTSYYFDEANVEELAERRGLTIEECKEMLDTGEMDIDDIHHYCGFNYDTVTDYKVVEK